MPETKRYIRINGKVFGPLTDQQLVSLIQKGRANEQNEVSSDNVNWSPLAELPGFNSFYKKYLDKTDSVSGGDTTTYYSVSEKNDAENGSGSRRAGGKLNIEPLKVVERNENAPPGTYDILQQPKVKKDTAGAFNAAEYLQQYWQPLLIGMAVMLFLVVFIFLLIPSVPQMLLPVAEKTNPAPPDLPAPPAPSNRIKKPNKNPDGADGEAKDEKPDEPKNKRSLETITELREELKRTEAQQSEDNKAYEQKIERAEENAEKYKREADKYKREADRHKQDAEELRKKIKGEIKVRYTGDFPFPGKRMVFEIAGIDFPLRYIPHGEFKMGSNTGEDARQKDEYAHQVKLTHGFYLLETEVTQQQYEQIMHVNPSRFKDDKHQLPVENVSWDDCQEFIQRLNEYGLIANRSNEPYLFALPTEAQWEHACRAGAAKKTPLNELRKYVWGADNSGEKTHEVGALNPNEWELYDMLGNVGEWVSDAYYEYSRSNVSDPVYPTGELRVFRGGSFLHKYTSTQIRPAFRDKREPQSKSDDVGFRIALVLQ